MMVAAPSASSHTSSSAGELLSSQATRGRAAKLNDTAEEL